MQLNKVKVICIGSALVDTIASSPRQIDWGDDVPGYITSNVGGVAFNICQQLALSQFKEVELLTALGKDAKGSGARASRALPNYMYQTKP